MPTPERPNPNSADSPTLAELIAELAYINRKLELANENENTMERFFIRDALLEQRDMLEDEIAELNSPSE